MSTERYCYTKKFNTISKLRFLAVTRYTLISEPGLIRFSMCHPYETEWVLDNILDMVTENGMLDMSWLVGMTASSGCAKPALGPTSGPGRKYLKIQNEENPSKLNKNIPISFLYRFLPISHKIWCFYDYVYIDVYS